MTQSMHHVMRIDGHHIAYAQQGQGSPVVLIHGIPTSHLLWRNVMPQGVHNKEVMTDEVIDLYLSPWSTEEGKKALFRNLRRLNPEYTQAIAGELKHLASETLILWAENDVFQKPAYASKLQQTIPNARLIWIKDAGHWLMEEKAKEISRHLITFLEKQEDSAKSTMSEVAL